MTETFYKLVGKHDTSTVKRLRQLNLQCSRGKAKLRPTDLKKFNSVTPENISTENKHMQK